MAGSEDFFLVGAAMVREPCDDGRLEKETVGQSVHLRSPSAKGYRAPFFQSQCDVAFHFLSVSCCHQRPKVGGVVRRIADAQPGSFLHECCYKFLVEGRLNENARAAEANLTLICEGCTNR